MKMKNNIFFCALLACTLSIAVGKLDAGMTSWATGKVFVTGTAAADNASKYSSLTVMRYNIPGEMAVQLAGPDATDPTRIFPPSSTPAYYLTDAGSQWTTALSTGQQTLAVIETTPLLHGWSGPACAGAVSGTVTNTQIVSGLVVMPDLWLSVIPVPTLASADTTHISISITSFADLGGQALDLSVWRQTNGSSTWQWLGKVQNPPTSSSVLWNDTTILPNNQYQYSITVDFSWPGGAGAGALSGTTGVYSTQARAISESFAASIRQPPPKTTTTVVPTPLTLVNGWMAYPDPARGNKLWVAFNTQNPGNYEIQAFTLNGALAAMARGSVQGAGQVITTMNIAGLASGIYLIRVILNSTNGGTQNLPLHKIAVLK